MGFGTARAALVIGLVGLLTGLSPFEVQAEPTAGVGVSKANAYAVVAPPLAVWVAKGNAYAVIAPPLSVWVTKGNAYAVVAPPLSVWVSKAVVYAVVGRPLQSSIFIMTRNLNSCSVQKENSCRKDAGFVVTEDPNS